MSETQEQKKGRVYAMRLYRAAIDRAISLTEQPHVGGHRNRREPLKWYEQEHHDKVDRYLRRRAS